MADQLEAAHHYAVLIGVDAYSQRPLEGCVRDVHEIEQYLRQKVRPLSVRTFVAPRHTDLNAAPLSLEDGEALPTYSNVTTTLREITATARTGDYVYVHFSGHGTRTSHKPDDDFSNEITGDLALMLLSETDDPALGVLKGPTLAKFYIQPMVKKGLVVTLVLDCCFSASVYRREGYRPRFFPPPSSRSRSRSRPLKGMAISQQEAGVEMLEDSSGGRVDDNKDNAGTRGPPLRDASMRPSWLLDPDGYAILSACGAEQEAGETIVGGVAHGILSYFLRRSWDTRGGCRKTHAATYRYICAEIQTHHEFRQRPHLSGNKDQGFFGRVDVKVGDRVFDVVKDDATGEFRLRAGRAHVLSEDDRLLLFPVVDDGPVTGPQAAGVGAKIVRLGALTSVLEITDTTAAAAAAANHDHDQRLWTASPLTPSAFSRHPIRLSSDLPVKTKLQAVLAARSLTVCEGESSTDASAFLVRAGEDQRLELRDSRQDQVLARVTGAEAAADHLEHLVRFAMVKDLTNTDSSSESLRECFEAYIERDGQKYPPESTVAMCHGEDMRLVLENTGSEPLFCYVYDLDPNWQVKNLVEANGIELCASTDPRTPFRRRLKTSMTVPDTINGREGPQVCEDYIKVIVTSQQSIFDSLELPPLGQATAARRGGRPSILRTDPTGRQSERWASVTFHVTVSKRTSQSTS